MKRRILSIIMVALLLLPAAYASAASTPVIITSDDVRGNVGDTVTVALNITVDPPKLGQTMDSLQFVLEYDSAALEYVGIQELSQDRINILGAQYMCSVTTKAGAVAFTAATTGGVSGSGVLMRVRFRILSAVSTMLVLKKVSYSFVTTSSGSQKGYTGGTINLGRITGQTVPTTIAPMTSAPYTTQAPVSTNIPTNEPRFPVTEVTLAPGASPTQAPAESDNDILAYIVFGLFIIVAILICVVLTLMIVRRSQNRAKYFEDDQGYEEDTYEDRYAEDQRSKSRKTSRYPEEQRKPAKKKKYLEEDDEDEPPIRILRRGNK